MAPKHLLWYSRIPFAMLSWFYCKLYVVLHLKSIVVLFASWSNQKLTFHRVYFGKFHLRGIAHQGTNFFFLYCSREAIGHIIANSGMRVSQNHWAHEVYIPVKSHIQTRSLHNILCKSVNGIKRLKHDSPCWEIESKWVMKLKAQRRKFRVFSSWTRKDKRTWNGRNSVMLL